jgi:hypothetical protein
VHPATAAHEDVEPGRERVDDRRADAVQAAGGLVAVTTELATRVQLGQHQLDACQAALDVDVDRDATAVVVHLGRAVLVEHDLDALAVAGQRLVDGVVDDLVDQVGEALGVGRADVHARPLADRFEALQDREVLRGVTARGGAGLGGGAGHTRPSVGAWEERPSSHARPQGPGA